MSQVAETLPKLTYASAASLKLEEFAAQEKQMGERIHYNDGVWWHSPVPGFSVPLIREQAIALGSAKPAFRHRVIGYAHAVPLSGVDRQACLYEHPMVHRNDCGTYDIAQVSASRRSKIRRGMKKSHIINIVDVRPYLSDALAIVVSARERTGSGLPVTHYQKYGERWKADFSRLASLPGRFLLGATTSNRLVSYLFCTAVERTLYIGAAKNHTEFLQLYANDALLHCAFDLAYNELRLERIVYGDYVPNDPSLNYFKESYGFTKVAIPRVSILSPVASVIQTPGRRLLSWWRGRN
jgi:hypothetical protein